jgi:predicted nucleotidyltransferase
MNPTALIPSATGPPARCDARTPAAGPVKMTDLPYTLARDPEIEDGVRRLVEDVLTAVVQELTPSAVLLHGSLGRGEGFAYRVGDDVHLASDIDLVAVYQGPTSILRSLQARKQAKALSKALRTKVRVDVVVRAAILLRWPPASLTSFKLQRSARVLYGQVRLAPPSRIGVADIPPGDITNLLLKRGADLLTAWTLLAAADGDLRDDIARTVRAKVDPAFLACVDAWLYQEGAYDHRTMVKADRFRRLFASARPRLYAEFEATVREWLVPAIGVDRSRTVQWARWRRAVEEWLACYEGYQHWNRRTRVGFMTSYARRHPLHFLARIARGARRYGLGLASSRTQVRVVPMLLKLTLGEAEPRDDANLRALVGGFSRVLGQPEPVMGE